jgi:hypothetical protein
MEEKAKGGGKFFDRYGDVVRLLIGFGLTTVVGGALGIYFQDKSWTYQHRETHYEAEVIKASEILNDISHLLDRRQYRTRRLISAYKANDREEIKEWNDSYQKVLIEWNESLNRNFTLTQGYFGQDVLKKLDAIRIQFRQIDNDLHTYRKAQIHNQHDSEPVEDMANSLSLQPVEDTLPSPGPKPNENVPKPTNSRTIEEIRNKTMDAIKDKLDLLSQTIFDFNKELLKQIQDGRVGVYLDSELWKKVHRD